MNQRSRWDAPDTVAGFSQSPPNPFLIRFAAEELQPGAGWLLDIGCGAGRNAIPLARLGWQVLGVDLSRPMQEAAASRAAKESLSARARFAVAQMDALPARDGTFDFIVAHGVWNLARSAAEFRRAVADAARVAKPHAPLFVFTFSRHTLPDDAQPVSGEPFVFTQFSGEPQCFLTAAQLVSELDSAGFAIDARVPLAEHNLPKPGALDSIRTPVIYEGVFRRVPTRIGSSSGAF